MSIRANSYDNQPSYEKYRRRKCGTSRGGRKSSRRKILARIIDDIRVAMQKRGDGFINANNFMDAVTILKSWLGRHSKGMIMNAFSKMQRAGAVVRDHEMQRFELRPHVALAA